VCALKEPRARFTRRHSKANTQKHVSSSWARLSHTTQVSAAQENEAYIFVNKKAVHLRNGGVSERVANTFSSLIAQSVWIWSGGARGVCEHNIICSGSFHIFRMTDQRRRTMDAVVSRLCVLRDLIFACDRAQFTCTAALSDLVCGSCWA
jgi:hypothetical protein